MPNVCSSASICVRVSARAAQRARGAYDGPERARARVDADAARRTQYLLRLYVTGTTPKSMRAIENVRRICEEHLDGRYTLEVIDLYTHLPLARGDQIVAAPTLIKRLPGAVAAIDRRHVRRAEGARRPRSQATVSR